jgi:long-chain acyl-CoA synthetase
MASTPKFETLVDIFTRSVTTFASREAFGTKKDGVWQYSTYADFGRNVDRLRGGLASVGVGRGDRVAIISNNREEWAVAAYATYTLGAAFVPMYEAQLEEEWEFILKDCDAKVLLVATRGIFEKTRSFLGRLPSLKHLVLLEDDATARGEGTSTYRSLLESGEVAPLVTPAPSDIAGFIYTSGTTGAPKGVLLSHWNIASNVAAVHEIFPIFPEDRSLSFLPWAHVFGQSVELHVLLSNGASMGICESADKILANLADVQPTLLFSVPRVFNKLYAAVQKQIASKPALIQGMVARALQVTAKQREGTPLDLTERLVLALTDRLVFSKVRARFGGRLKYAFSGGAAISREVAEFIDSLGVTVYEGYGLTETSPIATANYFKNRKIGSVGKALPHIRIEIDSSKGGGEKNGYLEGEILIFGPNVMVGYHNRAEENAAVLIEGASGAGDSADRGFRSGDMGYLDSDGFLYITGRIKEQYKLENGKYVVPTPLEEQLKLSPYVANVMIFGDNRPYNVALIVANVEAVQKWASKNGLAATLDADALLSHPKVTELFRNEVDRRSTSFKGFESVEAFAVISQDFTTENGMLTPSLKLKRRAVVEAHGPLLAGLYLQKRQRGAQGAASAA